MPEASPFKAAVDLLAYLVGRAEVKYGGDPAKSSAVDLSKYIDPVKKTVRSVTGQITADLARGLYLVDAPQARGATGFPGSAGPQKLSDVTVDCANQSASVVVAPLDDRSIATSRRLLVQVGTVCRPTGWRERPIRIPAKDGFVEGSRIIEVGTSPWQVEKQPGGMPIVLFASDLPPAPNGVADHFAGIGTKRQQHETFVPSRIVESIRDKLPLRLRGKIVIPHLQKRVRVGRSSAEKVAQRFPFSWCRC
ncbi:MAG: hypothetical protein NTY19_50055 [Planctomycetota bacterium]|nr:hypothetical protein [Planctomycetota bacterium]